MCLSYIISVLHNIILPCPLLLWGLQSTSRQFLRFGLGLMNWCSITLSFKVMNSKVFFSETFLGDGFGNKTSCFDNRNNDNSTKILCLRLLERAPLHIHIYSYIYLISYSSHLHISQQSGKFTDFCFRYRIMKNKTTLQVVANI